MASKDNQSGTSSSSEMDASINFTSTEIYSRTPSSNDIIVSGPRPDPKGKGNGADGEDADHLEEDDHHVHNQQDEPPPGPPAGPPQQVQPRAQPVQPGAQQVQPRAQQVQPRAQQNLEQPLPQPRAPALKVHRYHCIPDLEGKCFRCTMIPIFILFLASIGLLVLFLVVVVFEVNLHKTHEIPRGALQAVNLNNVLPRSNLLSEEVCITDEKPTPNVTVALARERCSQVNTTKTYSVIYSLEQVEFVQGLLFYWLEDTEFSLNISVQNVDSIYVRLQKSTENGKDNLRGNCVNKVDQPVFEWTIDKFSCDINNECNHQNQGRVNETNYYYLCFDGDMTGFYVFVNLHQYDYGNMEETCIAPCCMSYSNLFTELDHESSTCMFLVSNVTATPPLDYLRSDITKVDVTTKIGIRWWVFGVLLFLTVVVMVVTGVLCIVCTLSKTKERYQTARVCRHVFTCSCYRLRYDVIEN